MPIHVDFTGVTTFEPIPVGVYPVEITNVEERVGKDSNEPYLNWEFTINDGEHKGRKLWATTTLQKKGLWKLLELMEAVTGKEVDKSGMDFEPSDYLSRALQVSVVQESYQGVMRNAVKNYLVL